MDPAQAPTLEPRPPTGITAAPPSPPVATPVVPPLPFGNPPNSSPLSAAWPRSAQLATAFLLGVAATLLIVHCFYAARGGARPADLENRDEVVYRVDLNRATLAELQQLPGVGPKRAEEIDRYRRTHEPFRSVEELRKVPGFGPATVERLREFVTVSPLAREPEPAEVPAAAPKKGAGLNNKEAALKGVRIDINRASAKELQRLPRIGPKLSQRIVDQRERGRFKTVDELRWVPGIGPKTLEKLRPYVTVGDEAKPP
jgi:competence protein ComEA